MSDKNIKDRISKLEKHLSSIDQEVSQLTALQHEFESKKIIPTDIIWNCEKCGSRLGIYDLKTDELRVRYRDFFAYWKAGKDGYLKLVCRTCSHINELKYEH